MNQNRTRNMRVLAVVGLALATASVGSVEVRADGPLNFFQRKSSSAGSDSTKEEKRIRLFFASSSWEKVLNKVAEGTGSTLVADRFPPGSFSRKDIRRYSRTQAVRILNNDLEQAGFRLLEKGTHLVLVDVKSRNAEYQRQTVATADVQPQYPASVTDIGASGRQRSFQRSVTTIRPGDSRVSQTPQRLLPGPPSRDIRQVAFQDTGAATEPPVTPPNASTEPGKPFQLTFKPTSRTARALSSTLFSAFRERAEVVEEGPGGLPAMEVYSAKGPNGERSVLFAIAVDLQTGEMLVEGEKIQVERIVRLLQRLDVAPKRPDEATRVITTDKNAGEVAKNLQPAVDRLVAQGRQPAANPAAPPEPEPVPTDPPAPGEGSLPDLVGGIRGDVSVEAMEELGVLILKGNQPDVDAVMEIIRQIEELSARSAPDIHVRLLTNVDSTALAELLTSVYSQLNQARGRTTQQGPQISVVAVGRPNAVLILSPTADLESVLKLIDELDTPVNPHTSFAVFALKYGIASLVQQLIAEFYDDRGGLEARATVVTDVRTNSLVVLAKPNDLREIAALIKKLDSHESGAVSEVRVVELRHSIAEDLANTVNQVIQSVLNPPQLGQGQLGQAFLGFGGGNASQALREVRSAVLEYLVVDDANERRVRSGILGDIRITGDPRSNSIVITAPAESLDLVEQLIRRLDKPSSTVATIKHFMLKNADATSVTSLLNELFGEQTTGQNQQVGVQLVGAENASSVVPLKFSTDVRTNSIVAVGTAEALEVVEALLFRLDESDIRERETTIIRLKNAPAADIATAIDGFLQQQTDLLQSAGNELISPYEFIEREVIIQAETYTNSLLISATPRYFDRIREMVLTLDQELAQVVIQVMLVEVTLEDTDEFGIELGAQDPILFGRGSTTSGIPGTPGFNFNTGGPLPNASSVRPDVVAGQALSNFMVGRGAGLVLSASSEYLNVLLRALEEHRDMEILSRPQIRTLDNRPALIRMVSEQPRVDGFTSSVQGPVPTVSIAEAGIILRVTPTISPDGNILLAITAEKSAFDNDSTDAVLTLDTNGNPIRATIKDVTQAETTVVVADEQTIVLGGLITKSADTVQRRVPWLSDIPVIGGAFGFETEKVRRTELLMFLTPRIIKGEAYNEMHKRIESDRLHFTEYEAEQMHGPLYGIPASNSDSGDGSWRILTPPEPELSIEPMIPATVPGADPGSASNDAVGLPTGRASATRTRRPTWGGRGNRHSAGRHPDQSPNVSGVQQTAGRYQVSDLSPTF